MNEQISAFLRKPGVVPITSTILGFGSGIVVGYMLTRSQYKKAIEEIKEDQLQLDFSAKRMTERFGESIEVVAELREVVEEISTATSMVMQKALSMAEHTPVVVDDVTIKATLPIDKPSPMRSKVKAPIVTNVFDQSGDEWDHEEEYRSRSEDQPYVIHVDEYVADEMGYDSQSTLTWYEGDQVLCDSSDRPIYNPAEVVGELKFGHGSKDPNVVFIRNEKLKAEYEILRDHGSYQSVVLGEELEHEYERQDLRHSMERKFKRDD
jgi:hypothetical protein